MNLQGLAAQHVMTPNPIVLYESDFTDIFTVLNLFRQHQIRHLPILDDRSRVLGIVTIEFANCYNQFISLSGDG